ncbi:MAG: HlyD family efflux transporter periplasmic adaptor subunit [Bacteroidales bacterium]|nr:HlyD family efflux transporter periplasmic adaptor subunit [Bacteroidales bacterium]
MEESKSNTGKKNIEFRSEEVQELLGYVPRWITRWGISLISLIICGLLIGSWFFKYPDVITSPLVITTENPPASVVAKSNGKIQKLFVVDEQFVKRDQHLAVIENPARYQDIIQVKNNLNKVSAYILNFDTIGFLDRRTDYILGMVQSSFSTFVTNYHGYQSFISIDYHLNKIKAVRNELKKYKIYYNRLYKQKELLNDELLLSLNQTNRDSILFHNKVIPLAELDKSVSTLLQKKHDFEQSRINLSKADIQISELEQEILDYEMEYTKLKKKYELQLIESFNNLSSEIARWEQAYLIKAPSQGYVSFTKFWTKDQNVLIGEKVLTIVPEDSGTIMAKMNLSIQRSGKVKKGQRVNIKIDNYPYMEYGMLKGFISKISMVPSDDFYMAEVQLPDSLTTYYKINLEFDHEMKGVGEIITEDRRLFSRIIEPIKYIADRNLKR